MSQDLSVESAQLLKIAEKYTAADPGLAASPEPPAPPTPTTHSVTFTGKTSEFFSIWIVNTFLNVITLGFYSPWAKIRTKRYFYGHTAIDGHTFDYVADPIAILKGRVLVMVLLAVLYGGALINPLISLVGWVVVFALSPWAIVKSLSFNLKNTTHRGVRFGFVGQTGELFSLFISGGLLQAITLGLYAPIFARELINFKLKNTRYGDESFRFEQGPGFYWIYAGPGLLYFFMTMVIIGVFSAFGALSDADSSLGVTAIFYLLLAVITALIQGGTFNYVAQHLTMDGVRFSSTLKKGELAWIYFTNLFAVVLSLGLALPWVLVRNYAYKAKSFKVHIDDPALLARVTNTAHNAGSAAGDAATDLMDIEVGI